MYNMTNLIMVLKVAFYVLTILTITGSAAMLMVNHIFKYAEKNNKSIL